VLSDLLQDVRFGVRMLIKSPIVTVMAVASIALGIGANTAIFSLMNAVLLRPLSVHEPERLVTAFARHGKAEGRAANSYPDYLDYRESNETLEGLAAGAYVPMGLKGDGAPEAVLGHLVSDNYFDVMGATPLLGRGFLPEEGVTPGAHAVAVLSYGCWQLRFGGDPSVVGRQALISGYPFTVVGVMPQSFGTVHIGLAPDVWVPIMMQTQVSAYGLSHQRRGSSYLELVGRLKPGVTIEQAEANLEAISAELATRHPRTNRDQGISLVPADRNRAFLQMIDDGTMRLFFVALLSVVVLVLLIACFNVASLLLARTAARRQEMAVRLAVGAGRGRIVRQLLIESMLLAGLAGAVGIGIALALTRAMAGFKPPFPMPVLLDFSLDSRVLGYTLAACVASGLLFGLAPAMQALRPRLFDALSARQAGSDGARRSRFQIGLVTAQIGLSMFLLITAGLALRSLAYAISMDVGFNPDNAFAVSLNLAFSERERGSATVFYDQLVDRVEAVPGVTAVGLQSGLPLGQRFSQAGMEIDGYEPGPDEEMVVMYSSVSAGYFDVMEIPILAGRPFLKSDDLDAERAMVVNRAFADRYWPARDAVGQTVRTRRDRWTVIGVSETGQYMHLSEPPTPLIYMPRRQTEEEWVDLVVRVAGAPAPLVPVVLGEIQELDPTLPLFDIRTLHEHLGFALLPSRMLGVIVGAFGALALLLALVGVYGVMAYSVGQRTREFGIRAALGAEPRDILGLVMKQGVLITFAGIALGVVAAVAATRVLSSLLLGVEALDPLTFIVVAVLLAVTALGACLAPAVQAVRVDPSRALRSD
jgi:predicted permease